MLLVLFMLIFFIYLYVYYFIIVSKCCYCSTTKIPDFHLACLCCHRRIFFEFLFGFWPISSIAEMVIPMALNPNIRMSLYSVEIKRAIYNKSLGIWRGINVDPLNLNFIWFTKIMKRRRGSICFRNIEYCLFGVIILAHFLCKCTPTVFLISNTDNNNIVTLNTLEWILA